MVKDYPKIYIFALFINVVCQSNSVINEFFKFKRGIKSIGKIKLYSVLNFIALLWFEIKPSIQNVTIYLFDEIRKTKQRFF